MNKSLNELKSKIRAKLILLLVVLLFLPTLVLFWSPFNTKVQAAWIDPEWQFRQVINISSHSALENNVFVSLPSIERLCYMNNLTNTIS